MTGFWKKIAATAVIALSLILPLFITSPFIQHILVIIGINTILVLGLDMALGHCGLVSLGHAGFMGIGAYTGVLLVMKLKLPFLVGLLGGTVAAGLCGILIGYPSLRLRGHYFVIVTFICGIVFTLLFTNLISVTKGPMGIPRIPPAEIAVGNLFTISFKTKLSYYYLVITSILVLLYIKRRLYGSKMGRALIAVREDEDLAKSVGISTNFYKVTIFAVSTAIAGFAGVLYAHYVRFIGPDSFTMVQSFNYFVMNLIGGSGTMIGPLIGPMLLTTIDELSQFFKPEIARVLFGLALIVIILYMPKGIMGLIHRVASRERI